LEPAPAGVRRGTARRHRPAIRCDRRRLHHRHRDRSFDHVHGAGLQAGGRLRPDRDPPDHPPDRLDAREVMELGGLLTFLVFFLTLAGIYAVMTLGLNVQWGFSGQFNIGIAGFWALGSYTAAILTTGPSTFHLGGFGLHFVVGMVVAGALSALLALLVGLLCVNLRTDYLAIATIGIGEIVRLVLKNEEWLTNGVRGIPGIPRPFAAYGRDGQQLLSLCLVLL